MADASYLEKMGRELKCPICLSLLDSAMSLTCNHVFCNSCIHQSMRSASNCPVCKVPYQRREIRPAPHMDNLVNIYKSMEVASGLSLFVTQNPSTTKSSDAEKHTEGDGDAGEQETGGETPEMVKLQRVKGTKSKTSSRLKSKNSGRNRGNPSFPTNKRVQVPQSPTTETPVREAINQLEKNKLMNNVTNQSLASPSVHPPSNGKGSPACSPFFWLREDDEDKLSQRTDLDQLTGTPAKAPSFSDIKDSDDDMLPKFSQKEELLRKSNNADLYDSEMFEWTQRACSPELCSTPIKIQVGGSGQYDGMQKEESDSPSKGTITHGEVITEHLDNVNSLEKDGVRNNELHSNCKIGNGQNGRKMPRKRGRKASKRTQLKRQKKNVGQVKEAHDGSETYDGSMQSQGRDSQVATPTTKADCAPEARHVGSVDSKLLNEIDDPIAHEFPASLDSKRIEDRELKKSKRNFKSIKPNHRVNPVKRKRQKQNLAKSDTIEDTIVSQEKEHEVTSPKSKLSNGMPVEKACSIVERSITSTTHCKNKLNDKKLRCEIENRASQVNVCQHKVTDGSTDGHLEAQAAANNVQGICKSGDLGGSSTIGKARLQRDMLALRKCGATSIKCAFCHSTEDTEASGEMVHYSEGRPVSKNHSAGYVIHSHRNCAEWAPNVYFEGDIAVNLEEELARSRRIKCSLCGVKGAALGCYETSCRKSFHVPCAKLLRECRWDTDHFVILCPNHASSKLPSELSVSKIKKGKSNMNGKFVQRELRVTAGHDTNPNLWSCGRSSEKLVLCCSGLATADKETISEFAKSSGVVVSKNWNASVTHVIASVDENEACRRTLKVLMGILEGKWILSIKWVQACMKAMKIVEETPYEIGCDIHGVKNGPRLGRLRLLNKQPKLFAGFKFYFSGEFVPTYKGYLQDLVTAAGGTVLHRKPVAETHITTASVSSIPPTIIIYSIELPDKCDVRKKDMILGRRQSDAEALASSSGSKVVNNSWLLNCIAGYKLQDL